MKKISLFFVILVVLALLSACETPYASFLSVSTHFQGIKQVDYKTGMECPSWSGISQNCVFDTQTLIPDTDKSLTVPIVSYMVGRVQLNHATISSSWGLVWFDSKGNTVNMDQMNEGVFYTYKKITDPAGFALTYQP